MINLHDLTIKKTHDLLINKEISAFHLTKEFFDYIEQRDKKIGAYLALHRDDALEQANDIDKKISAKEEIGMLAGIPIAIKDNILVKNHTCTSGSKILENYKATYDATVIKKLKKSGAIILGKTNLDEFAMGSSTETSSFQITKNPLDETCVPGGSSGGSAAAVASHQAITALGSDTGGSVRQPASFCGLVGLKPTYGAVSRFGLAALASSLDQIGTFTKTVEDAALMLETISGEDKNDNTSMPFIFKTDEIKKLLTLKGIKIGIIKECFDNNLNSEIKTAIDANIKILEDLGAEIKTISLPHIAASLPCYYILMPAEASANLARYDGLRYASSKIDKNLKDLYFEHRGKNFGQEVRRRIMLGAFVLSSGYYDAYYLKAKKVQQLIKDEFRNAFNECDVLISPTTPSEAFKIGEKTQDPVSMYLSDIFTVPANIAGLPAISLPIKRENALPYGLQLTAKHFDEKTLLAISYLLEKAMQ
jgi:aspartyl-tRNA(Asn)/glutamyl-tRNA(Gln) amidotransferase subunit A